MRKVLFVTNYPSPYRVDFFSELGKKQKVSLTVLFLENPEEQTHRDPSWFISSYEGFSAGFLKKSIIIKDGLFICTGIFKYLREQYDEVIFGGFNYLSMMCAMVWMNLHKKSYSIEIDGAFVSNDSFLKSCVKKYFISHAERYYCTGKESEKYLLHYGGKKEKIFYYPFSSVREKNILSQPLSCTRKDEFKCILGISEKKMGLFVGQIIDRKGVDVLLKAAAQIPKEIGIYVVGGMPREHDVEFIKKHQLTNVHFVGFKKKEQLAQYYCAADMMVFPTREDIWGLVVNEALSYGLPVITTDRCIAGLEMVDDGKTGIIIKSDDDQGLANAIKEVLTWDSQATGMLALEQAKKYTIESMAARHAEIWGCEDGQ